MKWTCVLQKIKSCLYISINKSVFCPLSELWFWHDIKKHFHNILMDGHNCTLYTVPRHAAAVFSQIMRQLYIVFELGSIQSAFKIMYNITLHYLIFIMVYRIY